MNVLMALLAGSVICDVIGQLCFKRGVEAFTATTTQSLLMALPNAPWILAGLLVYAIEFIFWFAALSRTQLSFAMPFSALGYVGVILASRWVLGECISTHRWYGTLLVSIGVAVVYWPG